LGGGPLNYLNFREGNDAKAQTIPQGKKQAQNYPVLDTHLRYCRSIRTGSSRFYYSGPDGKP
jgi:hypothetical protein